MEKLYKAIEVLKSRNFEWWTVETYGKSLDECDHMDLISAVEELERRELDMLTHNLGHAPVHVPPSNLDGLAEGLLREAQALRAVRRTISRTTAART